jgi:predicted 3-demethylubiquinone-9 3-methyltransferase (glyoxalase superfamily)
VDWALIIPWKPRSRSRGFCNKAKRAFEAMMTMVKIDVARIEAAAEAA